MECDMQFRLVGLIEHRSLFFQQMCECTLSACLPQVGIEPDLSCQAVPNTAPPLRNPPTVAGRMLPPGAHARA